MAMSRAPPALPCRQELRSPAGWCRATVRHRRPAACGWHWPPPIEPDHVGLRAAARHRHRPRRRGPTCGIRPRRRRIRARVRWRFLPRARHNQWPMPLSPFDKGRGRSGALDVMLRPRVRRTELQPLHILRQAEDAVCVGADEVSLQHELGDLSGIIFRHIGFAHGIDDQTGNGCRGTRMRLWWTERS